MLYISREPVRAYLLGRGGLLDLLGSRLLRGRGLLGSRLLGRCLLGLGGQLDLTAGALGQRKGLLLVALGDGLGDVVVERGLWQLAGGRVLLVDELFDRRAAQTGASLLRVTEDSLLDHNLYDMATASKRPIMDGNGCMEGQKGGQHPCKTTRIKCKLIACHLGTRWIFPARASGSDAPWVC